MTCFYLWAMATVICSNPQSVPPIAVQPWQPPPAATVMRPTWPAAPINPVTQQPLWSPPCLIIPCPTE